MGMRTKYTTLVALICGLLYVTAIVFAIVTISNSISDRKAQAQQDFIVLSDKAAAAAALGFMSDPFREAVKDTLEASKILSAAMISDSNGVVYAIEKKPGYLLWNNGEPRFADSFGLTKPPFVRPIMVEGYRNVTISAVAEEVDYTLIQKILLNSLITVLIALVLAVGTIAFSASKPSAEKSAPPQTQERTTASGSIPLDEEMPFEIPDMDTSVFQAASPEEPEDCADGHPRGLYTPLLSVSWEDYTKERLEAELHRSASFEQDLTVMIVAFPGLSFSAYPELCKQIADQIVAFFTFRDLIFEWKGHGFCILLPNIDLDHSFKMAEEFRTKLLNKINSDTLKQAQWGIGLSSRSGRLLDADRLLREASRALEKALEDKTSPIVAFKSDPERYRSYIANKA
jgi:GGDEF domain-containing protein